MKLSSLIDAVIFDLDGVIIDSEPIQSQAFVQILQRHGVTPALNHQRVVHTIGLTERDNWNRLAEQYHLTISVDTLLSERKTMYEALLKTQLKPMPGLVDVLRWLQQHHYTLAIASSSRSEHVQFVVRGLQIQSYFSMIVSGNEVTHGKPDPDIYLLAAEQLGLPTAHCLVIEDAPSGITAAKAAGMTVIALQRFGAADELTQADHIVTQLSAITELF